jgi:hypothetical protein
MTTITIRQMCEAVQTTLGAAAHLKKTQTYRELSEGIHDTPLLQIYWESLEQDTVNTGTERTTFRGGTRQTEVVIYCDLYARPRSDLAEGMDKTAVVGEELITILEAQDTKPYFGLTGIKAFHWRMERAVFSYGNEETKFDGARLILTMRVF